MAPGSVKADPLYSSIGLEPIKVINAGLLSGMMARPLMLPEVKLLANTEEFPSESNLSIEEP
jgi:hypothetical protein